MQNPLVIMARILFTLIVILCFLSCQKSEHTTNKFEVSYNHNIETYFLAELLAVEYRTTNSQWETYKLTTCKDYQPIVNMALDSFQNQNTFDFANITAKFCDTLVSYGYGNDIMMPILLQIPEFKTHKQPTDFQLSNLPIDSPKKAELVSIISDYLDALYQFYIHQDVASFFKKHAHFYEGAIQELNSIIPANFTDAMEHYYGETRHNYVALISPMEIWPIEENEGRGISATVDRQGQKSVAEIMSPYVQIPVNTTNSYQSFGYDYQPTALFLTIHEFSHSFVNPALETYRARITNSSHLFTDELKQKMESKGISNWNVYVIESLVRLGEIRIAALQNDHERENRLRTYHTETENFIFLPQLEIAIKKFENNRDTYPMWKDFIPELLEVFENSDPSFVNQNLNP